MKRKMFAIVFFVCFCFCFLSFCHFLGRYHGIWRFPGLGSNWSCRRWPTPEPQQHGIQALSATYTTAHGNAGSPSHWARPGIEPSTSCFLVGFINHCAMTGTPAIVFLNVHFIKIKIKSPSSFVLQKVCWDFICLIFINAHCLEQWLENYSSIQVYFYTAHKLWMIFFIF